MLTEFSEIPYHGIFDHFGLNGRVVYRLGSPEQPGPTVNDFPWPLYGKGTSFFPERSLALRGLQGQYDIFSDFCDIFARYGWVDRSSSNPEIGEIALIIEPGHTSLKIDDYVLEPYDSNITLGEFVEDLSGFLLEPSGCVSLTKCAIDDFPGQFWGTPEGFPCSLKALQEHDLVMAPQFILQLMYSLNSDPSDVKLVDLFTDTYYDKNFRSSLMTPREFVNEVLALRG